MTTLILHVMIIIIIFVIVLHYYLYFVCNFCSAVVLTLTGPWAVMWIIIVIAYMP
jgi:hypothetical protein